MVKVHRNEAEKVKAPGRLWARVAGAAAIVILLSTLLSSPAQAGTFLFTWTTTELQGAGALGADPDYAMAGYFSLFAQPETVSNGGLSQYSILSETLSWAGTPGKQDQWLASENNPQPDPGTGQWAGFYDDQTLPDIALISGNTGGPGGSNIFLGNTFGPMGTGLVGWWGPSQTVTAIIPGGAQFTVALSTTDPITNLQSIAWSWKAGSIVADTPSVLQPAKYTNYYDFQTSGIAYATPEPGTLALLLGGLLVGGAAWLRRKY